MAQGSGLVLAGPGGKGGEIVTVCDRCGKESEMPVRTVSASGPQGDIVLFGQDAFIDLCSICLERLSRVVKEFLLTKEPRAARWNAATWTATLLITALIISVGGRQRRIKVTGRFMELATKDREITLRRRTRR